MDELNQERLIGEADDKEKEIAASVAAMHRQNALLNDRFSEIFEEFEKNGRSDKAREMALSVWEDYQTELSEQLDGFFRGPASSDDKDICEWISKNYVAFRFLTNQEFYGLCEKSLLIDAESKMHPAARMAILFMKKYPEGNIWGDGQDSELSEEDAENYREWNEGNVKQLAEARKRYEDPKKNRSFAVLCSYEANQFEVEMRKLYLTLEDYATPWIGWDKRDGRVQNNKDSFFEKNQAALEEEGRALALGPRGLDPRNMQEWVSKFPRMIARGKENLQAYKVSFNEKLYDLARSWYDAFVDRDSRQELLNGVPADGIRSERARENYKSFCEQAGRLFPKAKVTTECKAPTESTFESLTKRLPEVAGSTTQFHLLTKALADYGDLSATRKYSEKVKWCDSLAEQAKKYLEYKIPDGSEAKLNQHERDRVKFARDVIDYAEKSRTAVEYSRREQKDVKTLVEFDKYCTDLMKQFKDYKPNSTAPNAKDVRRNIYDTMGEFSEKLENMLKIFDSYSAKSDMKAACGSVFAAVNLNKLVGIFRNCSDELKNADGIDPSKLFELTQAQSRKIAAGEEFGKTVIAKNAKKPAVKSAEKTPTAGKVEEKKQGKLLPGSKT